MASLTFRTSRSRRECVKPVVLVVLPVILVILSPLAGAGVAAGTRYLNSFAIQVQEVYADHLLIKATGSVDAFNNALVLVSMIFRKAGNRSIVRFSRQLFPLR